MESWIAVISCFAILDCFMADCKEAQCYIMYAATDNPLLLSLAHDSGYIVDWAIS